MSFCFRIGFLVALILGSLTAFSLASNQKPLSQDPVALERARLDPAIQHALKAIREHLLPEGYWPTATTLGPTFENPNREFNVYVSSMIVSLLDPVASKAGLTDVLERARNLMRRQIEENGLVRYYGRPDLEAVTGLRCKDITPDADDTALVWIVAPTDDHAQLNSMLRTLKAFRTSDGLYKTWLAPPEDYRCIPPGGDPNPVDVTVQMHVFLMFLRHEPELAASLCERIGPAMEEDRFWVYYAATPIIPILREADLARQGCSVSVPERRLRKVAPGQDIWVELAEVLRDALMQERGSAPVTDRAIELLNRVAAHSFTVMEDGPPHVYHGDFSNSRRSYWSPDFGYAMWLRLYWETIGKSSEL